MVTHPWKAWIFENNQWIFICGWEVEDAFDQQNFKFIIDENHCCRAITCPATEYAGATVLMTDTALKSEREAEILNVTIDN